MQPHEQSSGHLGIWKAELPSRSMRYRGGIVQSNVIGLRRLQQSKPPPCQFTVLAGFMCKGHESMRHLAHV
jgi:hypothetical protein